MMVPSMETDITIAKMDGEILATYELMKQLRPHVMQPEYLELVRLQEREVGFQLAVLRDTDRVVCLAGFRFCRSLGWGKFLYVDDLVTDEGCRSRGSGKAMFEWLVQTARAAGCDELRLDSAVYRHAAHRFYLRERMDIACFNFRLVINGYERPS
jgi:GNAT superfamily N-acetyltransferase